MYHSIMHAILRYMYVLQLSRGLAFSSTAEMQGSIHQHARCPVHGIMEKYLILPLL